MKTTVEISDPLLREARKLAERDGVTLRSLVERELRRIVADTKPASPFKLRCASFKDRGLQYEVRGGSWSACEIWPTRVAALDRRRRRRQCILALVFSNIDEPAYLGQLRCEKLGSFGYAQMRSQELLSTQNR